jgi:hypothetical protein
VVELLVVAPAAPPSGKLVVPGPVGTGSSAALITEQLAAHVANASTSDTR